MTHDPVFFPDPDTFRPERFMGDRAQDVPFADPSQLVFGFGRRYVFVAWTLHDADALQTMSRTERGRARIIPHHGHDAIDVFDRKG